MQKQKNPLLIVLAVCGGCVFLGIIVSVILAFTAMHKGGAMINGFARMTKTMPRFILDLQSKDYTGAASLVDPSVSQSLSAEKIQHMEEAVEKKLGPFQSFSKQPVPINAETPTGGATTVVYTYQYTLTYQKGTAKADLTFNLHNSGNGGGLVSAFTLEPDAQKQGQ